MTEGDHLQQTLSSKDDNEHHINIVQNCVHVSGLVSSFYHHRHHIEPYQDHYYNIKGLFCGDVEDVALNYVLKQTQDQDT